MVQRVQPKYLLADDEAEEIYTLFEALTRFQAGYEILQPQMTPITKDTPPDVLTAFATLVTQLANNSDWIPNTAMFSSNVPVFTLEQDVVTDRAVKESDSAVNYADTRSVSRTTQSLDRRQMCHCT